MLLGGTKQKDVAWFSFGGREGIDGFAFGASGESSFKSGKTRTRHVKGTCVGTIGKVAAYDFGLGEIPKSIEAITETNGFKFKTIIRPLLLLCSVSFLDIGKGSLHH